MHKPIASTLGPESTESRWDCLYTLKAVLGPGVLFRCTLTPRLTPCVTVNAKLFGGHLSAFAGIVRREESCTPPSP